jgi:hypothetical protein
MWKVNFKAHHWFPVVLVISGVITTSEVSAHGEYWNDFIIDNKNDIVETTIEHVRKEIADIVLARRKVTSWPDPVLRQLKIELVVLQEELEYMLEHLKEEDGIHLQLPTALRENPQAGRSVAASHAVEMAIMLVDHIAGLEDQYKFEEELHEEGIGAYMFDLMDAYADTMSVYKDLQAKNLLIEEKEAVISSHGERTLGQDLKFHLGRFFRWIGLDGLADPLMEASTAPVDSVSGQ